MVKQGSNDSKLVGTISNKLSKLSHKEIMKNRVRRLNNLSEGEIAIMKKYGTYNDVMKDIILDSQLGKK